MYAPAKVHCCHCFAAFCFTGIAELLSRQEHSSAFLERANARIVKFLAGPNLVNTFGTHVGAIVRVYPRQKALEDMNLKRKELPWWLCTIEALGAGVSVLFKKGLLLHRYHEHCTSYKERSDLFRAACIPDFGSFLTTTVGEATIAQHDIGNIYEQCFKTVGANLYPVHMQDGSHQISSQMRTACARWPSTSEWMTGEGGILQAHGDQAVDGKVIDNILDGTFFKQLTQVAPSEKGQGQVASNLVGLADTLYDCCCLVNHNLRREVLEAWRAPVENLLQPEDVSARIQAIFQTRDVATHQRPRQQRQLVKLARRAAAAALAVAAAAVAARIVAGRPLQALQPLPASATTALQGPKKIKLLDEHQ
jgi:hypothetical protein